MVTHYLSISYHNKDAESMNEITPALVVTAYRRPESLSRLLRQLCAARYPDDLSITLVISIDGGGHERVVEIANELEWLRGEKRVITHSRNMGLRDHIISCGDLSLEYGSVIVLEDDLIVSPDFYIYAKGVGSYYSEEKNVAQVSLYSYIISELTLERFMPLYVGDDVYFMQWASSWGQLWTASQWSLFKDWYINNKLLTGYCDLVPRYVLDWPESSWKKFYIAYMCSTGKYTVFPYFGVTSPYGDDGENISSGSLPVVQSPLSLRWNENTSLPDFSRCKMRYDSYFQPEKILVDEFNPNLRDYEYVVDFTGTRPLGEKCCLSVRRSSDPIYTFDWNVFPWELNVGINGGSRLSFGESRSFSQRLGQVDSMKLALWGHRIMSVPTSIWINTVKLLSWAFSKCVLGGGRNR